MSLVSQSRGYDSERAAEEVKVERMAAAES